MSGGIDYTDIVIVACLWGFTNPFLRKGTYELEAQLKEVQGKGNVIVHNDYDDNLQKASMDETPHYLQKNSFTDVGNDNVIYNHESTTSESTAHYSTFEDETNPNKYALHTSPQKTSTAVDPNKATGSVAPELFQHEKTSYVKGTIIQLASKICTPSITKGITKILHLTPKGILQAFFSGIKNELMKFTYPAIAIPFIINQTSAFFYYKLVATSNLTNVSYCGGLAMSIEGVVSYLLGERMSNPWRGFGGAFIVLLGVGICIQSNELENYFLNRHQGEYYDVDENDNDDNDYERRFLETDEHSGVSMDDNNSLFAISPYVCWFAVSKLVQMIIYQV